MYSKMVLNKSNNPKAFVWALFLLWLLSLGWGDRFELLRFSRLGSLTDLFPW
jgi:hypothetical protein